MLYVLLTGSLSLSAHRISEQGLPIASPLDSQGPQSITSFASRLTSDIHRLEHELSDKKSTLTWKITPDSHILNLSSESQPESVDPVWFRLTGTATSERPASDMPSDDSLIWEEQQSTLYGTDQYV